MTALSGTAKRDLLARVPLLRGLGAEELEALVAATRVVEVEARDEVFHKGDAASDLYIVVQGRFKALTTSVEGDDIVFNVMGPGEVFGEVALLSARRRSATVRALEDGRLMALSRSEFLAFLDDHPRVIPRLLSLLAERLVQASEFVEEIQFSSLPVRLAKKVVSLAQLYGVPSEGGGVRIDLRLSQEEWGDLVGATRESVNKQLRSWGQRDLVRVESGYLTVLDPEALERLAFSIL